MCGGTVAASRATKLGNESNRLYQSGRGVRSRASLCNTVCHPVRHLRVSAASVLREAIHQGKSINKRVAYPRGVPWLYQQRIMLHHWLLLGLRFFNQSF